MEMNRLRQLSGIEEATPEVSRAQQDAEAVMIDLLGINNVNTQGSDSLDFHDISVESIKEALMYAWELGRNSAEG